MINTNTSIPEATLRRGVNLACQGNAESALLLIGPFCLSRAQHEKVKGILLNAKNTPFEAPSLQKNIVEVLEGEKLDPVLCMNQDITRNIFSKLLCQDLGTYCQVSKAWNKALNDDVLWMMMLPGIEDIMAQDKNAVERSINAYVKNHAVMSLNGVVERFEKFNHKVVVKGSFRCFFPFNPGSSCHINVQYAYCDWIARKPELKEQWICLKELQSDARSDATHSSTYGPLSMGITYPPSLTFWTVSDSIFWSTYFCNRSVDIVLPRAEMDNRIFNVSENPPTTCNFPQKMERISDARRSKLDTNSTRRRINLATGVLFGCFSGTSAIGYYFYAGQ